MNKVTLIGRLTRDPEMNKTASGIDVCNFTLAINRTYKDAKGSELTDFIPVVVWRNAAVNCGKYLTKGSLCAVAGSIQTRTYEKEDEKRYITEVIADIVQFLPSAKKGEASVPETVADMVPVGEAGELPY